MLNMGNVGVPPGCPPSREVRAEEPVKRVMAVKSAFHDFVNPSCTSGRKELGWTVAMCIVTSPETNRQGMVEGST